MMKYNITYSCAHEGVVDLIGKEKARESLIFWYEHSGLCPECKKRKEAEDAAKEAAEALHFDKENGLPAMDIGTERQIAWALTIRRKYFQELDDLRKKIENIIKKEKEQQGSLSEETIAERKNIVDKVLPLYTEIFATVTDAKFWIDNREREFFFVIPNIKERFDKWKKENKGEKPFITREEQEAAAEMTMRPESQTHDGVVEIQIPGETIHVYYKRDNDFYKIIKYSCGFTWNGAAWERICNQYSGSAKDRAAELVNKLLHNGFAVMCADMNVLRAGEAAEYEAEHTRWITYRNGNFLLRWPRDDEEDIYTLARRLPGSRWERNLQAVSVPASSWREISDFAEIMDFHISNTAKAVLDAYEANERSVSPATPQEMEKKDKLAEILRSTYDVLPDLRDD